MNTMKEGLVRLIRVVDALRVVRKIYDRNSPPITELPDIIRALADAPGLTDAELGLIIDAEREATRQAREKSKEINQLKAQDSSASQ